MKTDIEILESAKEASKKAYCPYSKFAVGACVLCENGNTYTGCNVENSSYGLSLCAERNAISSKIASGDDSDIVKIAIYSPQEKKCFPCGACRQWMKEFQVKGKDILIVLEGDNNEICTFSINELLPYSFDMNVI